MDNDMAPATRGFEGNAYQLARTAYDAQLWADTIRYSAQVLTDEPNHPGAFELLSTARRHLDRSTAPAGEQRILSVLMCDLVDSTRLPRLIGREPYRNLLRDVQEVCASAVTRYEGRVAQYLGDGILAYFSYPQAHEDDPLRAALAALAIVDGIDIVRRRRGLLDAVEVAVRIGIDTGVVMVSAMGAGHWTTSDSILGDPPNFAARLQAIAPPNGILVSEGTYERIAPYVRAKSKRPRLFKGFEGRRRSYEVHSLTAAIEAAGVTVRRSPLVGRNAERAALSGAWRSVLEGTRSTLTLIGDAGMGKTRLAEELANLVHATGGLHFAIRCSALHRHVPFYPVVVAVRRFLGLSSAVPALAVVRERLASIVDGKLADDAAESIAELLGTSVQPDRLPEQRRERALQVLAQLILRLAAGKRFLLLLDDLHDADPSTMELARRLTVANESFAIVAAARPELSVSSHLPDTRFLEIGPLADDACRVLAERILGSRSESIDWVVAQAGGSPFFAEELARWLERDEARSSLPPALNQLLTARIDAVEPATRHLLITASVIGSDIDIEDLVALVDLPRHVVDDGVRRLVDDGLLVPDGDLRRGSYQFRHSLFREAAYQRLLPSERSRQHLRLAEKYIADCAGGCFVPPAVVARHVLDGGERALALEWWHRAALAARATAAHSEAVQHYGAALELLDAIESQEDKSSVELSLQLGLAGSASMVLGYTAHRVLAAFERANALAAAMPHSPERFTATMGLYTFTLVTGQLARAEELVLQGLDDLKGSGLRGLEGTARASQAYVRFFRGRIAEAHEFCLGAGEAIPTIGVPQDPVVVSQFLMGMVAWYRADEGSERACMDAMRAANKLDGERGAFTRTFLLTYLAWKAQLADDAGAARSYATQAIALSQEHGFAQWLGAATLHLGVAMCDLDELAAGLAILEPALTAWRAAGAALMTPYFIGRLSLAKLWHGEPAAACALIDEAIELALKNDEQLHLADLYRYRARSRLGHGDSVESVMSDLGHALRTADALGQKVIADRARRDLERLSARRPLSVPRGISLDWGGPGDSQRSEAAAP